MMHSDMDMRAHKALIEQLDAELEASGVKEDALRDEKAFLIKICMKKDAVWLKKEIATTSDINDATKESMLRYLDENDWGS